MKKLILILAMMLLSFSAQAENRRVLECLWSQTPQVTETFIDGGQHSVGRHVFTGWVVNDIYNRDGIFIVTLDGPESKTKVVSFGAGWQCRLEDLYGLPSTEE